MIQASGIDHIVLHVSDVERAKKFYTEILGMTAYRENDRQVFLHAGQQGVALFKKQGHTPLTTGNDLNHLALGAEQGHRQGRGPPGGQRQLRACRKRQGQLGHRVQAPLVVQRLHLVQDQRHRRQAAPA